MSNPSDRLKQARQKAGFESAKEAAEAMGVKVPTYLQHENGTRGYPASRAQRYGRFFRVSPEWLLYGTRQEAGLIPYGQQIEVIGKVAAGVWAEAWELPPGDRMAFMGRPDVTVPIKHRFGVIVDGESMNLLYPSGTILECVSTMANVEIESGRRVIVQRMNKDGEFEVTVKEYLRGDSGEEWLLPRSSDPRYQTPIRADEIGPDILKVEIIGVVVASIRPE